MKRSLGQFISVIAALILALSALAGCATASPAQQSPAATAAAGASATAAPTAPAAKQNITLTAWAPIWPDNAKKWQSNNEVPIWVALAKLTGVTVQFTDPPVGQESDAFNLLIASNNFPDMIYWGWSSYPGGPDKAIADKVIIPLNDLINKDAPNLKAVFDKYPDVAKIMKSTGGNYYGTPFVLVDPLIELWVGPQVRKDLLDKIGMPIPTTIDEWTATLQAFKTQLNIDTPLGNIDYYGLGGFYTAYGVIPDFYLVNGKVVFGPMQPGYKDYLTQMAQWYKDGLLDKDYASEDSAAFDSKVINGKVAMYFAGVGHCMGGYLNAAQPQNPSFALEAVPYPVLQKGDKPILGQLDWCVQMTYQWAITTACKQPDEAMKWLDFCYDVNKSSPGHMLANFGTEGLTYTMVNGEPTFTDFVNKNPEGMSNSNVLDAYTLTCNNGAAIYDWRSDKQFMPFDCQITAVTTTWVTDTSGKIPPVSPCTAADADTFAKIMTDVTTSVNEMTSKFVMGQEPIANFDAFVAQLKNMNIDQAIAIKQAAYDAFNK